MAADPPEEGAPEDGAPEGQAPSQGGKAPPARTNGATGEQGPDGNAQQPGKAADPAKADTAAPAGSPRETAAPREGGASREGGARGATRGLMRTTEAGRAAPTRPAPRSPANQDAPRPAPQPASQPARGAAPARSKPPARPAEPAARAATASTRSGGGTKGAGLPVPASPNPGAAAPAGAGGAAVPATSPAQPAQPAKAAQPAPAKKKRAAAPPRQRVSRTAPLSIAAIHAAMAGHKEGHDPIRLAMKVVVRLASVIWLAGAVVVWMRLIGYESDLISPSWHSPDGPWISTSVAAAVMPVISVGLWLAASWGIALWFCALLAATVAFAVSPGSVPFGAPALTLNIITLAAVVGLGALRSWRNRDEYV